MSFPDINITLAAALYGVCRGSLSRQAALEQQAEAAPETQVSEETTAEALAALPQETPAALKAFGDNWKVAPENIRGAFVKMARFLNHYSHGRPVTELDRERAGLSLVAKAKELGLGEYRLPYAEMLETFVSVRVVLD